MNLSRPFILRPVATTLLMVAILLAGALAYRQLPVSALPQVDYPIIQVFTFYPGASPDVMASSVTAPLERQLGQMPGLNQMTSTSSSGSSVITLQFTLNLGLDVAEQEVQAADQCGAHAPADGPAEPARVQQGEPGRPADPHAGADVDDPAAAASRGSRRYPAGPEDRAAAGRGAGQHQRRAAPAVRVQANPTALASYGLTLEDLRTAVAAANVEPGEGQLRRPPAVLHDRRQRPAADEPGLPAADHRLSQQRPGHALRRRRRHRRCRERAPRSLDERRAGGDPEHPAAAGRQCDRGRRPHQATAAAAAGVVAVLGAGGRAHRPHGDHSGIGRRRPVRADAVGGAGGDGDLPLPAHRGGDDHSQPSPYRCPSSAPSAPCPSWGSA